MKLSVNLENCYGIQKLNTEFDFSNNRTYAIYAPNGVMKTSFANTFKDHSNGLIATDRVFTDRLTIQNILDEDNTSVQKENIFVIEPYLENFKSSKLSTLLVNKELREKYEKIHLDIDEKKEFLNKQLIKISGVKKNIEQIISVDITHDEKNFFRSLRRLKEEIFEEHDSKLSKIPYNKIFNDKVVRVIESDDFRNNLDDYISNYDQLINNSTFFKKGVFNHNNAADIAKNLKVNGFFRANHTVSVNTLGETIEITTEADLEQIIQKEKDTILQDEKLAKSFENIDKQLNKNTDLRSFRDLLEVNKFVLPHLKNLASLKQKLWVSYLTECIEQYKPLIKIYETGREEIAKIVEQAKLETTKWAEVIAIFNERFSVPFIVEIENQDEVILKSEAPNINFRFTDETNGQSILIEQSDLIKVLSNGEKRALYILNIIFEVEARKEAKQETIFIVDDIADSFDYKNKYAIIEYLKDISNEAYFFQILLTHNFDFFRTICSRLDMSRSCKLHTIKNENEITLQQEKYQNNPFTNWKNNLNENSKLVASIPFVRNIAEFCGDNNSFNQLTSLLHIKQDTQSITIMDLENIFKNILKDKSELTLDNNAQDVLSVIHSTAQTIVEQPNEHLELEQKIVLSISIRLYAENFMIKEINDNNFVNSISKNQTYNLISEYKKKFPQEYKKIQLLEQVNLMTPENIHLNSFMYEPILDMSNHHLKQLHNKIIELMQEG